jgi:thioredoxin-like negative regulator of GroEL
MLTDDTFREFVNNNDLLIVVFWQDGCDPCTALKGVLPEVARARSDIKFIMMNREANPKTAKEFEIYACPTMIFFRKGEFLGRFMGLQPADKIIAWVNRRA